MRAKRSNHEESKPKLQGPSRGTRETKQSEERSNPSEASGGALNAVKQTNQATAGFDFYLPKSNYAYYTLSQQLCRFEQKTPEGLCGKV